MMKNATHGQTVTEQQKAVALLVIDMQIGLFHKSTPIYKAAELLRNIDELTARAHDVGIPVFFVQHSDRRALIQGTTDWQLHPQLHPAATDPIIHKRHPNAFAETNLDEALQARNVKRVVVTGLVTHGCVQATCVAAKQLGYRVILVTDAHSNFNKDAARLIEQWHQTLGDGGIELKAAREVVF